MNWAWWLFVNWCGFLLQPSSICLQAFRADKWWSPLPFYHLKPVCPLCSDFMPFSSTRTILCKPQRRLWWENLAPTTVQSSKSLKSSSFLILKLALHLTTWPVIMSFIVPCSSTKTVMLPGNFWDAWMQNETWDLNLSLSSFLILTSLRPVIA